MRVPRQLESLVRDGLIDEVVRPLMTGKEATVYLVIAHGETCCAKAYKDASQRSFKNRADYQEGRRTRNSRRARAMQRGSKFGKREQEDDWHNAEVDALYRLGAAGVRVPKALGFSDGVLVMELIVGADGDIAPRLNDVNLDPAVAETYFHSLLADVVKMLCTGLIHGDLSEYNVLVSADGPVIIDLPQVIDAAANNNASKMLKRDVDNLGAYFGRYVKGLEKLDYGREIWQLYEKGELHPTTELTGRFKHPTKEVNVDSVLQDIGDAREEAEEKAKRGPAKANKRGGKRTSRKPKKDETWRGVVPDAVAYTETETERDADAEGEAEAGEWVGKTLTSTTGNRRVIELRPPTPPAPPKPPEKPKKRRRRGRSGDGDGRQGGQSQGSSSGGGRGRGGRRSGPSASATPTGGTTSEAAPKRRRRRRRGGSEGGPDSSRSDSSRSDSSRSDSSRSDSSRSDSSRSNASRSDSKPKAKAASEPAPRRRRQRLKIKKDGDS